MWSRKTVNGQGKYSSELSQDEAVDENTRFKLRPTEEQDAECGAQAGQSRDQGDGEDRAGHVPHPGLHQLQV